MRISVDISLYPLTDDFIEPILAFISQLETNDKLLIKRNLLSTQIFGEYREVMNAIDTEMEKVFAQLPHSVFAIKFIGNDRTLIEHQ